MKYDVSQGNSWSTSFKRITEKRWFRLLALWTNILIPIYILLAALTVLHSYEEARQLRQDLDLCESYLD